MSQDLGTVPKDTMRRYRKDFGDIESLARSIKERGQIQPIVVTQNDNNEYVLVAGERRLRACVFNQICVEAILKEDLTDLEAKLIELEENAKRKDIDWEEQCEAVRQIHELMIKEKGHAYKEKDGWNIAKTANYLGISVGTVSQDVNLANKLIEHPELKKRVTHLNKASARKLVKQVLEAKLIEAKMTEQGVKINYNLRNIACEVGIKDLPDNSVHCLITDPPFALDKIVKNSKGTADIGMQYNLTKTNVGEEAKLWMIYKQLIPELYRVMVDGAHFYIFLGMGWYCRLVKMMRENGFIVDDLPLIWNKMTVSTPARGAHYMSSYEACIFGHKPPQNRVLFKSRPNVLSVSAIAPAKRVHPLQRPFELLKIFIENSSSPGETILDCFCGSGSTLLAAQQLHRNSVGFELDKGNYLRALDWFSKESENENFTN